MDKAKLEAKLKKLEAEWAEACAELEVMRKAVTAKHGKMRKVQEQLDQMKLDETEVDWPFLLEETGTTSQLRYTACQKALYPFDLYHSGYMPELQQRGIQVRFSGDLDEEGKVAQLEKVENGLNIILPYMKSVEWGEKQYCYIDILEASCSQDGCYFMFINLDTKEFLLMIDKYHRRSMLRSFPSLHDLLVEVQKSLHT